MSKAIPSDLQPPNVWRKRTKLRQTKKASEIRLKPGHPLPPFPFSSLSLSPLSHRLTHRRNPLFQISFS